MSKVISLTKSKGEQPGLIDVLNELMKRANINISQLSKNINLAHTTVKRMCTDPACNPTLTSIIKIAQFFGITPNQLIGTEPLPHGTNSYYPNIDTWSRIPILTLTQLIGWPKHSEDIQNAPETKHVLTDVEINEHAFAIIAQDSSLEPKFSEGTILIFDSVKKPRNKDIILIKMEDKELPQFRQVLIDGSDQYVKPVNPEFSEHAPILLTKNNFKLSGVLVQAKSNYC